MPHGTTIQVFFRFRPISLKEKLNNELLIWKLTNNSVCLDLALAQSLQENKKLPCAPKTYIFSNRYLDECYSPDDSNERVYTNAAKSMILSALEGYNFTIFAYGQTGSGKTYTMLGSESPEMPMNKRRKSYSPLKSSNSSKIALATKGLLLLAIEDIFSFIRTSDNIYTLSCSYIEIYNENINDLLSLDNRDSLSINEDPSKGFYIKNLSERSVRSIEDVLELINIGENLKKYGNSDMNKHSSRSHTIFRVNLICVRTDNVCVESMINFVDLAGAERISSEKKISNAEALIEGKHINTSLFYLCQVIYKLSEKQAQNTHIPYRNSNLTKILRNSIGGNSLTSIVCTASPCFSCYEMTQSTLQLATLAKTIINKAIINIKSASPVELLQIYQRDIHILRSTLANQREENEKMIYELNNQKKSVKKPSKFKKEGYVDYIKGCGWIKGVGDIECKDNSNQRYAYDWERFEHKEQNELNEKILKENKELENDLQTSKIKLQQLESKNFEFLQIIEAKNKIIEQFTQKRVSKSENNLKIQSYIEALKKKILILESKALDTMTEAEIESLEKFYFKCIDKAKEKKISKYHTRKTFGEISDKKINHFCLWSKLGIASPVTPTVLKSFNKENYENISNN